MGGIDARRLVEPAAYKYEGYPHELWAELRREAPVELLHVEGWPPFWAVTRYDDIVEVGGQPETFINGPGIALERLRDRTAAAEASRQMRSIINMDPPKHAKYRQVAAPWFTQSALERMEPLIDETARRFVNQLGREGECDFVEAVAARYPLHVVATLLGVPEEDEEFLLELTREMLGREDLAAATSEAEDVDRNRETFFEFFSYYSRLLESRRVDPKDDLTTTFAHARIDGEPMGRMETLAYGLVTATAGHETTRGSVAGGLLALMEHPHLLRFWADRPGLAVTAADEILRFVSPVTYMMRTATREYELAGRTFRAGDRVVLFYASANRDEEVFDAPDSLLLERRPNRHLALGTGAHFCLGSRLARRMTGAILEELVTRVQDIELAGEPERAASNMIPSVKHLPIRYRIAKAPS